MACVRLLLLCNTLPQTWWLKTYKCIISQFLWVGNLDRENLGFLLRVSKGEIKMSAGLCYVEVFQVH
jgi:hypothetical protein